MAEQGQRPLPQGIGLNGEFYRHCAGGSLYFQRCEQCGRWRHPPRHVCAECGSWEWKWAKASGKGRVYTWTVIHQPMHPAFASEVPYAVVVVETEEGVRLVTRVRDCPPDRLRLGLAVELAPERVSESVALPWFRPVEACV